MGQAKHCIYSLPMVLLNANVMAGEIRCQGQVILDDQIKPVLKHEVLEKCGEPQFKDYDKFVYKHNNVEKILHFNEEGELKTITDEVAK